MFLFRKRTTASLLLCTPLLCCGVMRSELLPADGVQFRVANLSNFKEAANDLFLDELLKDKQYQDFSAAFAEKIKSKSREGKDPIEVRISFEHLLTATGEVVFTFESPPKESHNYKIYLAASENEQEREAYQQKSRWRREQSGADITTISMDFQNNEIIRNVTTDSDGNERSVYEAWIHGTLLLSHDPEWVKQNLVRLQQETVEEPTDSGAQCRFSLREWVRALIEGTEDPDKRKKTERLINTLGLNQVGNCTINVTTGPAGIGIDTRLEIDDLSKGLFTLMDTRPANPPDPGLLPIQSTSFSYGRINLPRLWESLPLMLRDIDPDTATGFAALKTSFRELTGADLDQDLIACLGTGYFTFTMPSGTNQHNLIAFEVQDGTALGETLEKVFTSPKLKPVFTVTEFHGETIYSFGKINDSAGNPSLCATTDHLLFGEFGAIRGCILSTLNKAHYEPPNLMEQISANLPEPAFICGALDHRKTTALLTARISDDKFYIGATMQSGKKSDSGPRQEALEENEISLNYLGSFLHKSYYYVEETDSGIHHHLFLTNEDNKE